METPPKNESAELTRGPSSLFSTLRLQPITVMNKEAVIQYNTHLSPPCQFREVVWSNAAVGATRLKR